MRTPSKFFFAISAFAAVALISAAAWFFYGRRTPVLESNACRGCNLLLITIDTLRADRVGAFGGAPGLTPNLDRLAAEGLRLTRTYSAAPLTLPSHASILTGMSPPAHGIRTNGLFRLGSAVPTIATLLKGAGFRTGAFVGSFVLDARFGLNRGFDVYDDRYGEKIAGDPAEGAERRGEDVIKPAIAWINQQSPINPQSATRDPQLPWFAWVHLYDPHDPYHAPEPYASQHAPYDAEVAYADAMVGRLLASLSDADQQRTLVMVAADHGESLGEHGERTHGVFVYDATMRVPWIIRIPNRGSRIPASASDALVRLIDLAPTALDLLSVPPSPAFEGRSIVPVVNGRAQELSAAYLEAMDANLTRNSAPLSGLVTRTHKFIELPIPELYDLAADPKEATNIFAREPERARTLGALLKETTASLQARGSSATKTTLSTDARQRLQALGYVASSAEPGGRTYGDADDPKRLIASADALNYAIAEFDRGERSGALAAVRAIVRDHPGFVIAQTEAAAMERAMGDRTGAIARLEDLARRGLANQRVMTVLADYVAEAGDADKAVRILEAIVVAHPDDAEAYNSLGVVEMRRGRHDRAQAAFAKVIALDPTSATAYANIGADALAARRLPAAIDALRQAVALDSRGFDALYNLGMALDATGRREEARPHLERFVREAPPARYADDLANVRALLAGRQKK